MTKKILPLLALLAGVSGAYANTAGTVLLTNNDATGTWSFNQKSNWNATTPPTAGNNYFNTNASGTGFTLRTPFTNVVGSSLTFAGDSLTLCPVPTAGADSLLLKGSNNVLVTVNNLILAGGSIGNGADSGGTATVETLGGAVNVAAPSRLNPNGSGRVINVTASLTGTASLTVTNPGAVILAGNNLAFTGKTIVNNTSALWIDSQLRLGGNPSSFAADQLKLDNGTLLVTNTSVTLSDNNRGVTVGSGGATFNILSGLTLTLPNPVTGSGNVSKAGPGTLIFSNANSMVGTLFVDTAQPSVGNDGAVRFAAPGSLGGLTTLSIRQQNAAISTLQLDGSAGSLTVTQAIAFAGRGSTTAAIENVAGNNTLSPVSVTFNTGGGFYPIQCDAGTLTITGFIPTVSPSSGTRTLFFGGNGNFLVPAVIQNGSGGAVVPLTKAGAGTLTLLTANTYGGFTTISNGILAIGASSVLPGITTVNLAGGLLNMGSFNGTVNGLQFSGVVKAKGTWGSLSSAATHKDNQFGGSGILTVTNGGSSTVSLASSHNPSASGVSVTFTATVNGTGGNGATPGGSVAFFDGVGLLGTGFLSGSGTTATATFSLSTLSIGSHNITASYGGDPNYDTNTSSILVQNVNPALTVTCSSNITVTATGPGGAAVTYTSSASGGCSPPPIVTCNPPSGSTFPIGTTPVSCTATDICGTIVNCGFSVTVNPQPTPQAAEYFFPQPVLPPIGSVYISPAQWHVLYAQGIVIRDVRHRFFTQNYPLPPLGTSQTEFFSSEIDFDLSTDNGATFQPASGTANVQVKVTHTQDVGGTMFFDTEMLQLDLTSGTLMLRESPTLQSTGQTTVRPVAGGYMVSSFFDIFTEVSTDGGNTWTPAQQPGHVEMHPDPKQVTPAPNPTPLLPPPNGTYVSPALWHALYAQGIVIRDVRHKFFTGALQPPAPGVTNIHNFNSQIDLQVSTDGGNTYQYMRVAAPVQVSVANHGSGANTIYDTEMTALTLTGLPNGVMIRESPTEPSRGQTEIDLQADGTYRISSFFDIFTELSLDGGASWAPATNGPVRMELTTPAPEVPKPSSNLPPSDGSYVSPAQWHALYANGIIITNASHDRFTQTQPPPPPGGSQTESFGSQISGLISMNGGASFTPFSAPANVAVQVNSRSDLDTGNTRFFDTEMLSLSLSGGTLPGGVMVRESPSKASLGRTSVRTDASGYQISSFFDIFTELSLDGGATWSSAVTHPGTMGLNSNQPNAILISCSSNITVTATGPSGAVVFYTSTAIGGCSPPPGVICNPPSGSTFPIGVTTVTCFASDACGGSAQCSFTVTVNPPPTPQAAEYFFPQAVLPPIGSVYISPALWHVLFNNGIIIRDVRHRFFTQNYPLPPLGTSQPEFFSSEIDFDLSTDNGATFHPATGTANVQVQVTHTQDVGSTMFFDTEMLQLDLISGTLMLRESPTLHSTGQTTVRPVPGGYMVSSFFDIFTEVSTDGGNTWTPAQQPGHVEMHPDPKQVTPAPQPTPLLPPPNGTYVSPALWHALYAQGIVIRDVRHKFFTGALQPPAPGVTNIHNFNSQIDLQVSTDGGNTYQYMRVAAPVQVSVAGHGSSVNTIYDTEMTMLDLSLPNGVMIRESPTEPSRGQTEIDSQSDGTYRISSFFDIFTELSLDGGASWSPATNGPVRMELTTPAPEVPKPSSNLPPSDGSYVSPAQWHALYANGVIITNASHSKFTQTQPPPPPGGSQTESFGSQINGLISMNGGASFTPFFAPASVSVQVNSRSDLDTGNTRFFDTEMLSLSLSGGTLSGGVMVRESPSKASLGRTSVRTDAGGYQISSFFDIFTELSLDGGQTWSPSVTLPGTMGLSSNQPNTILITCPSNITVTASGPSGAVVFYTSTASGGCSPPPSVICNPPSGSTFPIGITTVTCFASDTCGGSAQCSFTVTVNPPPTPQAAEYFFPQAVLPPIGSVYISPALWHVLYNQGIVIRDVRHRFFTQNYPLPPLGNSQTEFFSSEIDFDLSTDNGATFHPASGTANVQVHVTHTQDVGGTMFFDTEMLQLDLTSGTLMLRESPTLHSTGQTTVRPVPGGYMVSSFFDIFTEVSTDGGNTWTPAQQPGHVEMHPDPKQVTPVPHPTPLMPPPNGVYISPALWHALYAQGIVIRDVRHKFFTGALQPPAPGVTNIHNFNSQIDLQVSTDGGATYQYVRVSAPVQVSVAGHGSSANTIYDTEMTMLNLSLPNGVMIRESPTEPSRGQTEIDSQSDGTYRISSFFDIFTELSLDGGASWSPATNGPVRVELVPLAPEVPKPNPDLPPLDGSYVSPAQWHALYANGIIITNASHDRFTQTQPPPPPGGSQTENFGSRVTGRISMNGGASFTPFSAPANVFVQVNSRSDLDTGNTRFFDTEMLSLSLSGGTLPGTVMVRESPSKASLGRTSVRTSSTGYQISSFFDIFTEVSLDGGNTWSPAVTHPGTMGLGTNQATAVQITCPSNITTMASGPGGATVFYTVTASGGCTPPNIVANPPSGSTFPIGTTLVTTTASDTCGNSNTCNFSVTVYPQLTITCPSNITTVATGPSGANVFFNVNGSGGCSPPPFVTANPPSGSTFPVGTTTVTASVSDTCGNSNTCSFTVRVYPQVTIACPSNITTMATGPSGATVFYTVTASGGCTPPNIVANPASGSTFPVGTTMVTATASDTCGNSNTCSFSVTVYPRVTITCPSNITTVATGPTGANVFFNVNASGGCSPPPFVTASPPSGSTFPIGTTPVMATASDACGNSNTCSFSVTVYPQVTITCPSNITTTATGPSGATVFFTVTASGGCTPPNIVANPASGSTFPIGTTTVTATATDTCGNSNTCSFTITVKSPSTPIQLTCSPNLNVVASGPGGAVVFYTTTASGGCSPPPSVFCNPPSGSFFPVGVTTVTCIASDTCGDVTNCSFQITVAPDHFVNTNTLPPTNTVYISPAQWHALYAGGIVIRDIRHRFFTQSLPPPPLGSSVTENFSSEVDFEVSRDGGATFQPVTGTANVSVHVTHAQDTTGASYFNTEMLQLDLNSGGIRLRESPTLQSTGQTSIQPTPGGFMVSSFFDIFTEVSLDGGNTWTPSQGPAHVEMHNDPRQVSPVTEPSQLLPAPNDVYVSPAQWHALFAQGIVIKDVRHKMFTQALQPPPPGGTNVESFNSTLDLQVSTDGGSNFTAVRAQAPVQVTVSSLGSGASGMFDTEMSSLNVTLPSGAMLRESPTLPSRGGTQLDAQPDGTFRISSFFDIFTELSLDGGHTWSPATNGPVRMQLTPQAPEMPSSSQNLPLTNSPYISPAQWHAAYANGIYISNVTHRGFTQGFPPPAPGATNTENFGSTVDLMVSQDGGKTFVPASCSMTCTVQVISRPALDAGALRTFDTEMLSLDISGGSLPNGIRLRESPSKASLGRTSVRPDPAGGYRISSFFDIFTEVSLDGGNTWSASTTPPALMSPRLPAVKRFFPNPNLPPTNSQYISPRQWHALYANGIIISNVTHKRFLANLAPPPPRTTNTHNFGSQVNFLLSMGADQPFQPMTANADCQVNVGNSGFQGSEQVFQTEMIGLNLSGGSLPAGLMIRESPSKASLGETRFTSAPGGYRISSFFDIFTEVSLNGGNTWTPADSPGYMEMHVDPGVPPTALVQPRIQAGQLTFTVQTQVGLNYLLQYKNNLPDPTWTTLSITAGNGQPLPLSDPTSSGVPHRFYRVEVQEGQ